MALPISPKAIPWQLIHATAYLDGNILTVMGYRQIEPKTLPNSLDNHRKFWEMWQCKFTLKEKVEQLIQANQSGTAVAVSDGSF